MALTSWKTFNFFDVTEVKPTEDSETSAAFDSNEFSSLCSGSDNLFIGGNDGHVRILSSAFKVVRTFKAHDAGSITHMKQVNGTALLVTIAEDLSNEPSLKVWALDKPEKKTGGPKCLSTLSIHNGRKQFPISAFAALENLSQLAVGFGNGAVTVIRGDLIHDRGAKQRTVFESEEPITGIEFREGPNTTLYIATTGRILTLTITGKGQGQPAKNLEDTGCGVGCMTVNTTNGDIVVVRDDAIYSYDANGRGPSYAYEGPKQLVHIFGDYIALVSLPHVSSPTRSGSLGRFVGGRSVGMFNTSTFALLDTDLKYVAHTETMLSQVRALFVEWGDLFLFTLDGKVFRYHEKSLQQRLEILYQRDLYVLAINFAQKAGVDSAQRNIILRKYGDYLHRKGDYDTAMQQYLKAIDNTEPSQVIRKFLDSQRINNLIEYLEELHEHDKATVDHTTLLLNCYAKLKNTEKLGTFIKSGTNFDLDTAISMCRQGGYYDQAVFLAKKHGEHELVVDILIEDSRKYDDALDYIWCLGADLAYPLLMRYARVLLEHCPKDSTQLFISYYTGAYQPRKQPVEGMQDAAAVTGPSAVQNLASFIPLPYRQASVAPSPAPGGALQVTKQKVDANVATTAETAEDYEVPKPRTAFSSFVDHPQEFIVFLEACLDQKDIQESDRANLYTTLFELYLETANSRKGLDREEWEAKAKRLIDRRVNPIDASNVLLLSHLSNFRDGTTMVREQQGLRFDIFRSYTSANDTIGAVKALRKYGPEEPQLYPAALAYFTSSPKVLEEAGDEFNAVLKRIEEDGLMAPIQVIQTLSSNAVATMGTVKKYLSETIEKERKEISNNRRLIESYRTETDAKRKEIDELGNKSAVFNSRRCSACAMLHTMGGRKIVVHDSDDEPDAADSPPASDTADHELSLSPIINLQYSSPPKILDHSGDTSTASTEPPAYGTRDIANDHFGSVAESSPSRLSTRRSSHQHHGSPKITRESSRRATTTFPESKERRSLKTYGTKAGQGVADFHRRGDEKGNSKSYEKPDRSHRMGTAGGEHDATAHDPAASRVEAMLNNYHGAEDLLTSNLSLGSFPSIHTSVQTSMTPKTPKFTDGRGTSRSQQSTMPTVRDSPPEASVEAYKQVLTVSTLPNETMSNQDLSSRTSEEVHAPVRNNCRKRVRTEQESDDEANGPTKPSASQTTARSTNRDNSTEICDELASTTSRPQLSTAKRKPSETSKEPKAAFTNHSDELSADGIDLGLPKEQYQPRPSRSRSNRNDEDLLIPESFSKRPEVLAKKKASKRRKTTALAKPSPKVEIEDNDSEEGLALQLPQIKCEARKELAPVVIIPTEKPNLEVEKAGDTDLADPANEEGEVITREKAPPSSPAKKRRGRPRKQTAEQEAADIPKEDDPPPPNDDEDLPDLAAISKPISPTKRDRKKQPPNINDETPIIFNDRTDDSPSKLHTENLDTNDLNTHHHLSQSEGNRQPSTTAELSPHKLTTPPETPRKAVGQKGPDKHSPLNSSRVKFRVGLSKRARIEPLLKVVRK